MKQIYDYIVSSYYHLYSNYYGWNKILSPFRLTTRALANIIIPICLKHTRNCFTNKKINNRRIIVSLTSFPARIEYVYLAIKALFYQNTLPDKIILWLSINQFPNKQVPTRLSCLQNDIFEIRFVDDDIKSHKKYYYAFKEFPNDYVILIDDDIYYDTKLIEDLLIAARNNEHAIICRYGSILSYGKSDQLQPFNNRIQVEGWSTSQNFFLGTGGGTLFIPSLLCKDCTNKDLFMKLTPLADDIWLNAMVRLSNLKIVKIQGGLLLPIKINNNITLCSTNLEKDYNDVQICNVINWYTKTFDINPFKKRN